MPYGVFVFADGRNVDRGSFALVGPGPERPLGATGGGKSGLMCFNRGFNPAHEPKIKTR